jgi:glycosyltransferase involved in cell wall biosynthesis
MTTKNNSDKLKVLMCSEASFLSSGFGTYTKELLSRLHKTQKYTIAEFASYGFVNDVRDRSIDWIYYANAVRDTDPRHKEYSSKPENQFGRWRFEKVLLDFKPDVVIDIRDYWMSAYQGLSPLRKYFHWILMPTVDSAPQQEDWIDTYLSADAVFSYSDWGGSVIKEQSNNKINYIGTASPGVNLDIFKIKDKTSIRNKYGIDPNWTIIGSVMRNQKRKLIPELFSTFRNVLNEIKETNPELGKNLYLYLHTSYPDMGWDIPELLKEHGIANKVLFSYICKSCGNLQCSTFVGPQKYCPKCYNKSCNMPSVTDGITQDQLSDVYNLFDLYVQYAICEGFGMPQVEAGACGIPVATVDYSAMSDIITKLEAYSIPIKTKFKELETKAYRVYPDNDALKDYIIRFIQTPESTRKDKGLRTRQLTEQHYCWDDIANIWDEYLSDLSSKYRANWNINLPTINTANNINAKSNLDRMLYYCSNYYGDATKIGSYKMLNILKEADYGFAQTGPTSIIPFSFKNIEDFFNTYATNNNISEQVRSSNKEFDEDFILYAKMKASAS